MLRFAVIFQPSCLSFVVYDPDLATYVIIRMTPRDADVILLGAVQVHDRFLE